MLGGSCEAGTWLGGCEVAGSDLLKGRSGKPPHEKRWPWGYPTNWESSKVIVKRESSHYSKMIQRQISCRLIADECNTVQRQISDRLIAEGGQSKCLRDGG